MSRLPFVFALWVVRPDFDRLDELDQLLYEAAQQGVANLPQIAAKYAAQLGRETSFWQEYLEQAIHYFLTDEDREGLQKFQEMWAVHQLLAAQTD
jgi:predicted solute-binding protein